MDDSIMGDGDFIPNNRFGFLIRAMDHRSILNIRIVSNGDGMNISPHYGVEPDRTIITQGYFSHHHGVIGEKTILSQLGREAPDSFNDSHNGKTNAFKRFHRRGAGAQRRRRENTIW